MPPGELRKILDAAPNTAMVFDEAYAEFSDFSTIPWIRRYPNLFIARTFSKAAGLAALRLGAVIAEKDSLAFVRRAMPPFPVNLAALIAAEAALRDRTAIRKYVCGVQRKREQFTGALKSSVCGRSQALEILLAEFGPSGPALFAQLGARAYCAYEHKHGRGVCSNHHWHLAGDEATSR